MMENSLQNILLIGTTLLLQIITVLGGELPTIEGTIGTAVGAIGDNVRLKCIVENRNANATVQWFRLTGYLFISNGTTIQDPMMDLKYEIQVSSDGNYETTALIVKRIDESDVGRYRCRVTVKDVVYTVWPKQDGFIKIGASTKKGAPKITPVDDTFIEVDKGGDVKLRCDVSGNPEPKITWYRESVRSMMGTSAVLKLEHMKPAHSDVYRCEADNGISPKAKLRYHVNVRYKPLCSLRSNIVMTTPGSNATLQCYVSGYPVANITWSRHTSDGMKYLNPKYHRYRIISVKPSDGKSHVLSSLTVYNTTTADMGDYVCNGKNDLDDCSITAKINALPSDDDVDADPEQKRHRENDEDRNGVMMISASHMCTFIALASLTLIYKFQRNGPL